MINKFDSPFIIISENNVKIFIDPKIEIAYLVFELIRYKTGYSQYRKSEYMHSQIQQFSRYLEHPVFEKAFEMFQCGFSYDAIPGNLHCYNQAGQYIDGLKINSYYIDRAGGEKNLIAFIRLLADLYEKIGYSSFFSENKKFYQEQGLQISKYIKKSNPVKEVKNFYGELIGSVNICLTPDNLHGFGISIEIDDRIEMIPTIGIIPDDFNFIALLVHELSHPYINPEVYKLTNVTSSSSHLYEEIKEKMSKLSYPNWEIALIEHIVRANTIKIMTFIFGTKKEEMMIQKEIRNGFLYIEPIIEMIEEYLENQKRYGLFRNYIESILTNLTSLNVVGTVET